MMSRMTMPEQFIADSVPPAKTSADLPATSCCTAFYELDWVRQIAQDSFHPGGSELTSSMVTSMNLPAGARIADIGCGAGTSARWLAAEGYDAHALDLGINSLAAAEHDQNQNQRNENGAAVGFIQADARQLPFADNSFDALLAECSFSLVPNKPAALQEFGRVLKPGGRLGISDMAISGQLPPDMGEVITPWTCLADAHTQEHYAAMFQLAGFGADEVTDESNGLLSMISSLKRKLLLLAAGTALGRIDIPNLDIERVRYWMARFREEVENGRIRYLRFNLSIVD
jgi:arsenite methyltransferase